MPARGVSDDDHEVAGAVANPCCGSPQAREIGLAVNAGHDLTQPARCCCAEVAPDEVSIGHAFIADALLMGYDRNDAAGVCVRWRPRRAGRLPSWR